MRSGSCSRRLGRGRVVVDEVPVERRQVDVADALGGRRAGLRELARDATDLDDRQRGRVGQDDRHLQQDPQLLADRDRRGVVERLGAVARLEQERAPRGDLGERVAQRARLAREHERRHAAQLLARQLGACGVRPHGLLQRLVRAPRGGCPGGFGDGHAGPSLRREGLPAPRHARARSRAGRRAPGRAPRRARPARAAGSSPPRDAHRRDDPGRSRAPAAGGPAARR